MTDRLPSQTYLLTTFKYDQRRGILRRHGRDRPCGLKVSLFNRDHWSARVIWKMMTGCEPVDVVGFRDGDPANLRWSNLVEMTRPMLRTRGAAHSSSKSGERGVSLTPGGRWRARMWWQGQRLELGTFSSRAAAAKARRAARARLLGQPGSQEVAPEG